MITMHEQIQFLSVSQVSVDGLSTFPTIQRRDFGFRDSGALRDRSVLP